MMTKHANSIRAALVAALVGLGAGSAGAMEPGAAGDEHVRVVNNHGAMVNVYAEDSAGRMHRLGRVGIGSVEEFEIPESVADGEYRVKVYPSHPLWSANQEEFGVKTNPIAPGLHGEITFWLEPDLTRSMVEFRGD